MGPKPLIRHPCRQRDVLIRQKVPARITARGAFSDILKSVGGFVVSPVRTALSLIRRPGVVCREYIFGDRDRVLNPAAFAAWAATIYLAVNYAVQSEIGRFFDPLAGLRGVWPYIGMLLLAPVAALQKRLFRKHGLNWAETFSFGLYMLGAFDVALLSRERRVHLSDKPLGYLGTVLVGIAVGAGWTVESVLAGPAAPAPAKLAAAPTAGWSPNGGVSP